MAIDKKISICRIDIMDEKLKGSSAETHLDVKSLIADIKGEDGQKRQTAEQLVHETHIRDIFPNVYRSMDGQMSQEAPAVNQEFIDNDRQELARIKHEQLVKDISGYGQFADRLSTNPEAFIYDKPEDILRQRLHERLYWTVDKDGGSMDDVDIKYCSERFF